MPVPTKADRKLAEIDDLSAVVMIRLRTLQHAWVHYSAESVREPLENYITAVKNFAGLE